MSFMLIEMQPVAYVSNARRDLSDDDWGQVESRIELAQLLPEDALDGLESFSHLEILYHFHLAGEEQIVMGAEHPRENPNWPKVGIFAQRKKDRPNRLGLTTVEFLKREGRVLHVKGLDAIDGTPVLDIKPVMRQFLPRKEIRQPAWVDELMEDYFD